MTGQKHIFKGVLLDVYRIRKRLPNGFQADLEVIQHPGAALIVPFLNNRTVIMIRQYRPVIARYLWELPAGTLNPQERPYVCARRELLEEVGYRARNIKKIGVIYPAAGYATERIIIYEARNLKKAAACTQEDEIIEIRPHAKNEIKKLFRRGAIVDAKTICALRLANVI